MNKEKLGRMDDEHITRSIKLLRDKLLVALDGDNMDIWDYNELNRRLEAVDDLARELNGERG